MNQHLMRIVVEQVLYLSMSDEMDEDSAVTQLEGIAATLKDLTPEELSIFLRFVAEEAADEDQPQERREALAGFPEAMGLTGP